MTSFDVDPIEGFEVADAQIGFITRPDEVIVRRNDGVSVSRRSDRHAIPRRADTFPLPRRSDVPKVEKTDYIPALVKSAA
jgi:hypothetical protein